MNVLLMSLAALGAAQDSTALTLEAAVARAIAMSPFVAAAVELGRRPISILD